jgi:hypothetical protein
VLTHFVYQATMMDAGTGEGLARCPACAADRPAVEPAPAIASCPPAPSGPAIECEPNIVIISQGGDQPDERFEFVNPRDVQTAVVAALRAADIGLAFELDCTSYPCLALFAGEPPSAEDRAAVFSSVHGSLPDAELLSSTYVWGDGTVTWAFAVGEVGLTDRDKAGVEERVEDMLRP